MSNIVLSNGIRQNLLSLQQTSNLQSQTQLRLATGKRVNSAIDNPINYFTALSLNDRTEQLSGLLDGMSNAVQTITTASKGIDSISKLVQSAQATIRQAQNDAAQNKPAKTGTALATAGEQTATGQSLKDIALNKLVEGASATAATSSSPGSLGVGAGTTVTLTAGPTTYTFTTNATMTVRDLVDQVNGSGIATAIVDGGGSLRIAGTGSSTLKVSVGASGASNAAVGFAAADATTGLTASGFSAVRSNLVQQFNDLRDQMDQLAKDAGYNGINLLAGDPLSVVFNEKTGSARNALQVQGTTLTAAGLGIMKAGVATVSGETNFQDDTQLGAAADALTSALASLRSLSSNLGSNLSIVQTRQDFTNGLMTALKTGSDNLVNADQNEEGANLLALNTRQQLSQTALSLASQADQGVLRLFG